MNLWRKCIELLLSAYTTTTNTTDGRRDNDNNNGRQLQQQKQKQPQCRRSSVSMILEVNNQDNTNQAVQYGILHSIVCCKVPVPTLVEIGCIIFPEQLYQRDLKHKMIPLHHLLKAEQ